MASGVELSGTIEPKRYGLVMPIASFDGYAGDHWLEVKAILKESVGSIRLSFV